MADALAPPGVDVEAHPTVAALRGQFGAAIRDVEADRGGVPVVTIAPEHNLEVLRWLKDDPGQRYVHLRDVTGLDFGAGQPVRVVYEIGSLEDGRRIRLQAPLPLDRLEIASAVPVWRAADWLEREAFDMFGVVFRGHPDLRRILMPHNYEEGYPLRKDFPLRGRFSRAEQTRRALGAGYEDFYTEEELAVIGQGAEGEPVEIPGVEVQAYRPPREEGDEVDLESEPLVINIGPQHPATHGVLRLVLQLDGETVVKCTPHIGYLHSSFEKLSEYREWNQIIPLTDRMDYLAPMMYNVGYALAVEQLLGVEITPRCTVVRLLVCELNRILSHLLWLGTTAIDIGAYTPFLYTYQERERIYNLHEAYTGARMTTTVTRVGGMMADLPPGWTDAVRDFIETFPKTLEEVDALLTRNAIWVSRNRDVGTISAEDAIDFGLSGPNLRASGVPYDLRKDRPYLGYDEYDFDVVVGTKGDAYDRYLVRLEEMRQSVRILEQTLDRLPGGPINVSDPRVILPPKSAVMGSIDGMIAHFKLVMEGLQVPAGEVWYPIESSKGELGFYLVADGGSKPVRCRYRGPSFVNLAALPHMVRGELLADVIAVNASLDIVLGEIDR